MPRIIRFHESGTADVLRIENLPSLIPGEGEVRLKIESGALCPVIDRTFTLDAIADAHRYMESNEQRGKIVVTA